jgi:hypothetical protein
MCVHTFQSNCCIATHMQGSTAALPRSGGGGGGSYDINGVLNAATPYTSALWNVTKFGTVRSDASGYNQGDGYVYIYFSDGCTDCTVSYSSTTTVVPTTATALMCTVSCSPGSYLNTTAPGYCSQCPANTYLNTSGATNVSQCVACPLNSISPKGSPSFSACSVSGIFISCVICLCVQLSLVQFYICMSHM